MQEPPRFRPGREILPAALPSVHEKSIEMEERNYSEFFEKTGIKRMEAK